MCTRLDQSNIASPYAPTVHCSVVNCARHQNYRAIATRCRIYPYQYGLHHPRLRRSRRPCRTCSWGGANVPKLGSTLRSSGTSLWVFRYLCNVATYSLTFRSSAMDWLWRVSDSCRLRSVFATATVGICNRLYSLFEFVYRNQLLCSLHYLRSRLDGTPSTGGNSLPRNPPFGKLWGVSF